MARATKDLAEPHERTVAAQAPLEFVLIYDSGVGSIEGPIGVGGNAGDEPRQAPSRKAPSPPIPCDSHSDSAPRREPGSYTVALTLLLRCRLATTSHHCRL